MIIMMQINQARRLGDQPWYEAWQTYAFLI
jgi:hypothetical protein